eukprot:scaffold236738_cov18-Tisochrysis_lutea.AAC.2
MACQCQACTCQTINAMMIAVLWHEESIASNAEEVAEGECALYCLISLHHNPQYYHTQLQPKGPFQTFEQVVICQAVTSIPCPSAQAA